MKRAARPRVNAGGEVLLCSLGFSPARTPTLQVLRSLRRCRVVYCDERSPRLLKLLRLFCPNCRPVPARRGARGILDAASRGAVVAYAAFGQPMVFGAIARELARGAAAEGLRVSVLSGLSAFDSLLAANREVFGYGFGWYQVLEDCRPQALALTGALDRKLPTVAFLKSGSPPAAWKAVFQRLRRSYPASCACEIFEVSDQGERRRARACTVGQLEAAAGKTAGPSFVVVAPEGHDAA